ncbi:MAG: flagellar biosynthesis protein FlhF [Pseudomonadota bacterium]
MRVKRYFGPDARSVMRQIRREQGPEAVILSCNAAGDGTEIVTALPEPEARPQPVANAAAAQQAAAVASAAASGANDLDQLREEVRAMHGLLDQGLARLGQPTSQREPIAAACERYLEQCGISSPVAVGLLKNLPEAPIRRSWHEILVRLAQRIQVTNNNILIHGGRVLLAGPPGAGKTSTLAKLATRYVLQHGADSVALIGTDTHKIGAQSQLQRIAELLGVPLGVARSTRQLREQLSAFGDRPLVLVDTPGISIHGPRAIDQLKAFAQIDGLESHLVLSSELSRRVISQVLTRFGLLGLKGVILTHCEQLEDIGPLLCSLIERQLSVSYLSTGARIPEDLRPARAAQLAAGALSPATRKLINTEPRQKANA